MSAFTPSQILVLRQLAGLWTDRRYALVGATALGCFMPMRWRKTSDLDITVSADVAAVPRDLAAALGWRRHPKREHQWNAPGSVKVDIIPASDDLLAVGTITWPETGNEMSLTGMRLALQHPVYHAIDADLSVPVAPPAVIVLLKMVAYLDRPSERPSDLADISYAFDELAQGDDVFSDEVIHSGVDFSSASAFLMGRRMGPLLNDAERSVAGRFLRKVRDEGDAHATRARLLRTSPWGGEEVLDQRLAAFELGLAGATRVPPNP